MGEENPFTKRTESTRKGSQYEIEVVEAVNEKKEALEGLNHELGTLINGLQTVHRELSVESLSPRADKQVQTQTEFTG